MVVFPTFKSKRDVDVFFQIPTLASCSFDEIVDAAKPGQVQFMQL
jgi:hypothetical protein